MFEPIKDLLEKIPGYGIFAIAAKEINLIKTQKIALALILLYPLIVIATLGAAFSGNYGITNADAAFFAPQNLSGFDTNSFVSRLTQSNNIRLLVQPSEQGVYESIKKRRAKIGIIIHEPEPTSGRFVLDIITDNSSFVSSEFFFQVANNSVRRIGFDTSRELLSQIWQSLSAINTNLGGESKRIDYLIAELDSTEEQILDLNTSLNAIDVNEMRFKLQSQQLLLAEIDPKIGAFSGSIDAFTQSNNNNLQKIEESKEKLSSYKTQVLDMRDKIAKLKSQLDSQTELINSNPNLKAAYAGLLSADDKFSSAQSEIDDSIAELNNIQGQIKGANNTLKDSSKNLAQIKQSFASANRDLNYFNVQLSVLGQTIDKVGSLVNDSVSTKKKVHSDLESSKQMLESFRQNLTTLQALSPDFLSNPVIINRINVYNASNLQIITPMALVLLLLLTTILLTSVSFVVERNEGAYSRLLLSMEGKLGIFGGKVLGQLIFALVESAIILAIAIAAFNVKIAAPLPDLIISLSVISVSFIAMGLFVSNYTKIQSTTILSGLILVIPMMFLSGIIIPVELMSPVVQEISSLTPLSIGMLVMTETVVKGTATTAQFTELAKLLGSALVFFVFTLLNRNL